MKKIYCLLFAFIGVMANAQTIFSIAGGTGGGYGGDGGPATSAQLGLMQGPITKDAAGNIYIPDMNNQRIRKIDAVTGIITTIAGTGTPGYNGDAIAATSAKLNYPSCVLLDATGNIYIGEYSGYRIRKIDASTGLISTIIGNGSYTYNGNNILATSATTKEIGGLAIDAAGNIYFSDMGNQIIRKIIVSTGMVQTVAGTAGSSSFGGDGGQATSAQLWGPYAISLDASENIFIADELNNRIRKVVASTGIISTIAGRTNSMYDYNGDGIAADTADLYDPWGVAVDASGNVYIADADNNRIRKVNTNGIISTIAGNGVSASHGNGGPADSSEVYRPFGVYVDACGGVYITEYGGSYSIRKISDYNVSVSTTKTSCNGVCDGTINVSASGGAGSYTYSWNGGLGSGSSPTNICSGTYMVIVNDANGCKVNAYATVSQPNVLSILAAQTHSASCINDGSASASVSGGTAPYTYAWSNSSSINTASGLSAGNYSLMVTDNNNCVATQTVTIAPNLVQIGFSNTNPSCHWGVNQGNGSISTLVSGGTSPYSYSWSNGGITSSISGICAGNYTLTATDTNGCFATQVDNLSNASVIYSSAPICMVTVDSASQHNIVVWDKTPFNDVDSFLIYRETTTNVYKCIGSQSYASLSQFIDTVRTLYFPNTGNPNAGTYRYKIQMFDTCGNYSQLSPYHNTIYILNNSGTFYWTQPYTIENGANPVSSYVLMRDNLSNGNWQQVNSVAGSQQTVADPLYTVYQSTASWRVQTVWNITCTPTLRLNGNQTISSSFSSSFSNTYSNNTTSIHNNYINSQILVYPNPTNGVFVIETNSTEKQIVQVFDVNGKLVITQTINGTTSIDASNLNEGVYNMTIIGNEGVANKRLVIVR